MIASAPDERAPDGFARAKPFVDVGPWSVHGEPVVLLHGRVIDGGGLEKPLSRLCGCGHISALRRTLKSTNSDQYTGDVKANGRATITDPHFTPRSSNPWRPVAAVPTHSLHFELHITSARFAAVKPTVTTNRLPSHLGDSPRVHGVRFDAQAL